jgi:CBS domain-containing protein
MPMTGAKLTLWYLTQLERAAVVGPHGQRLAGLQDVVARLADDGYPHITGLTVAVSGRTLFVPADQVTSLAPGRVELREEKLDLRPFERRPGEVLLRHDVLGRRVIEITAGRLVRANDLALANVHGDWRLVGVALSRRKGPRVWLRFGAGQDTAVVPPLVDWNNVQPFVADLPASGLLMPLGRLRQLHPAQIADLVEQGSHREGEEIMEAVEADPELSADVFEELDPEHQEEFLEDRSNEETAALLAHMEPDAAVDMLNEMHQERRLPILNLLPEAQQQRLNALLQYHPSSAGGLMSLGGLSVPRGTTLQQVLDRIRADQQISESWQGIVFVVDDGGRFVGAATAVDVIRGDARSTIDSLPGLSTRHVSVHADLVDIALQMTDFDLLALPVTDEGGRFVGAVSVDDLLRAMVPEEWRRREQGGSDA